MTQIVPTEVERYLASLNHLEDPLLERIYRGGRERNLPIIDPEVGVLLHVLARAVGARRILEIGTAIGYSGLWLARALPGDGLLLTIELDAERAVEARRNFEEAGLGNRANVMIGDTLRVLHKIAGPFDLIFNDGNKLQYTDLLDGLIRRLRPGGLLVTDNVLRHGEVVPGFAPAPKLAQDITRAVAAFNQVLAREPRLATSFIPMRDGLAVSVRLPDATTEGTPAAPAS